MVEHDTQKDKYVTFKSGNEYFGLKIEYVNEIIVFQEITEIPESEDYIKGLINLRGKIIPVIDVRIRFKQEPFEYNDRTCIIVINFRDTVVGLIAEKQEVVLTPEQLEARAEKKREKRRRHRRNLRKRSRRKRSKSKSNVKDNTEKR